MTQTKKQSVAEVLFGLIFGFTIAWLSWLWPIPQLFDIHGTYGAITGVTIYFTVISFLRNYGVRRLFNYINNRSKDKNEHNTY